MYVLILLLSCTCTCCNFILDRKKKYKYYEINSGPRMAYLNHIACIQQLWSFVFSELVFELRVSTYFMSSKTLVWNFVECRYKCQAFCQLWGDLFWEQRPSLLVSQGYLKILSLRVQEFLSIKRSISEEVSLQTLQ